MRSRHHGAFGKFSFSAAAFVCCARCPIDLASLAMSGPMPEIDELRAGRRAKARRDPRLPCRSEERRTRPGEGQVSDEGLTI